VGPYSTKMINLLLYSALVSGLNTKSSLNGLCVDAYLSSVLLRASVPGI
jgi:hypothetical protein